MRAPLILFFLGFFLNGCAISGTMSEQAILFYSKTQNKMGGFYKILLLHIDCSELHDGEFQIESFNYQGEIYPSVKTKLEFIAVVINLFRFHAMSFRTKRSGDPESMLG